MGFKQWTWFPYRVISDLDVWNLLIAHFYKLWFVIWRWITALLSQRLVLVPLHSLVSVMSWSFQASENRVLVLIFKNLVRWGLNLSSIEIILIEVIFCLLLRYRSRQLPILVVSLLSLIYVFRFDRLAVLNSFKAIELLIDWCQRWPILVCVYYASICNLLSLHVHRLGIFDEILVVESIIELLNLLVFIQRGLALVEIEAVTSLLGLLIKLSLESVLGVPRFLLLIDHIALIVSINILFFHFKCL